MQTLLLLAGLALYLLGLFTGFAIPATKNPRMGLASHIEAHMNGMFLMILALAWSFADLDGRWEPVAVALLIYGAYANWFTTLLAAFWGAGGGMMKIAAPDHVGTSAKEGLIKFLLISLSIADVVGVAIVIWGVARG